MKRYKPYIDRLYAVIYAITIALITAPTVVVCAFAPITLFIMIPTDLFVLYFLISPLFGYAELRESSVFIKFGFFMKREIPYSKIRGVTKERKFYSDSMLSLKSALNHINIKYGVFDVVSLSVKDSDAFVRELTARIPT